MKLSLPGNDRLYADPDIIYDNGYYYLYPTTDGFDGWSGTEFYVFRSKDLISWENRGRILSLTEDVAWSVGSAWAPCMLKWNGKFYFYFCGKRPDGVSCIGVAVSASPDGPFEAMPEPVVTPEQVRANGCRVGQAIDPSVYVEDGAAYLLFGNGDGVICGLSDDALSVCDETMRNIEGLADFRESVIVVKEQGLYHFTWSCDDTGSENYHVNYGVSDTLYGPVTFCGTVLEKKPEEDILGTGHHCIFKTPEGAYKIGYHRFATPLDRYPTGKGYHRETCIDDCVFSGDGRLQKVIVTK